ncbi:hypothetical protein Hanom_Chr09g00774991 [Helianthus anomalus]
MAMMQSYRGCTGEDQVCDDVCGGQMCSCCDLRVSRCFQKRWVGFQSF